jgi:hypothetical protein
MSKLPMGDDRRVTAPGCEIIGKCEALILTIRAPAGSAMNS